MKSFHGYTLIEIIVALFLGSLLLAGLMTVYLNTKSNYRTQNRLADLQDRVQFLSNLLQRTIHAAGNVACKNDGELVDQKHAILGDGSSMILGECQHYKNKNQFIQMRYFVADTHRKDFQGRDIFALYRKPVVGEREELVSGVSNMKIQYGILSQNHRDISRYVSASAVDNWNNVGSVSITVSLSYLETIKLLHLYVSLRNRS